ncbi:hypothetical protein [Vibrio lentus]|uniref:hypothetical protein n=1 Tax=Vibrio lentus TaxID=136468 RepID=UPI000C85DDD9|nr:hypothetical protein [Vibrio lentus]PMH02889.1 hypothetical protein BCU78_09920 [Vibrio lentus]
MSFNIENERKSATEGRIIALTLTGFSIGIASLCLIILSVSVPQDNAAIKIPDLVRLILGVTGIVSLYSAASLADWVMDSLTEKEHEAIDETDIYADLESNKVSLYQWQHEKYKHKYIRSRYDQSLYRMRVFGYGYCLLSLAISLFLLATVSLIIEQYKFPYVLDQVVSVVVPSIFMILVLIKMHTLRAPDKAFLKAIAFLMVIVGLLIVFFGVAA